MKENKITLHTKNKIIKLLLNICIIIFLSVYSIYTIIYSSINLKSSAQSAFNKPYIPYWIEESDSMQTLTQYIDETTKKNTENFIPIENRIAVFNFDGTIFSESALTTIKWNMYINRVLNNPEYSNIATEDQIRIANELSNDINANSFSEDLINQFNLSYADVYSGMTIEEYTEYINQFQTLQSSKTSNLNIINSYYQPMLEVIKYLQSSGFTIYICGDSDRILTYSLLSNSTNISLDNIICKNFNYYYDNNNNIFYISDTFNNPTNKAISIFEKIGKQPVLCFGNNTADINMAKYTTTNNKYKSLAFFVCCDDTTQEYCNTDKSKQILNICKDNNYIPISMKNDWKSVYNISDDENKK